jgi:hypothetical protein
VLQTSYELELELESWERHAHVFTGYMYWNRPDWHIQVTVSNVKTLSFVVAQVFREWNMQSNVIFFHDHGNRSRKGSARVVCATLTAHRL